MTSDRLRNKKIAIVGLGTNNRHLADFLTGQGIKFDVIDGWKDKDELVGQLDNFDIIFRSPGLPYLSKAVQQAKSKGVEISSQTKLFFELSPAPIIGVTGTKGKGTTSSLIAKILEAAGKKVWLAGNIGKDPFEFIDQLQSSGFVVLELSSFQLQDLEQSPHIAVILSITPDHLNHHQNFEEYIQAKSNIIAYQKKNDVAVLDSGLPDSFKNLGEGQKIIFDPASVTNYDKKLIGEHNLDNIAAAASVAKVLGIPESTIKQVVASFQPLPHRLNILKQIRGVTYIDDGFSTNIEPTIAAINAIDSNLILIIGGSEKGLDFSRLGDAIKNSDKVKAIVVIGDVTDKIVRSLAGFRGQILTGATTMQEILNQAQQLAKPGDAILFSPATASFGLFKNEHDRAQQFVNAVNAIK